MPLQTQNTEKAQLKPGLRTLMLLTHVMMFPMDSSINRVFHLQVHGGGGYDSEFSDEDSQGETSQRGVKR